MEETEVIYGTIGTVPMGEYDPDVKYELLNLVSYDGSSYTVHTDPPIGTLPTDTNYWQLSAQGTSKATASTPGTVMPDGETTKVDSNGSLSVKTATNATRGLVKGSAGIKVAEDGSIDVNTLFTQATEMANIIAGEAIATALGKISKSIAVTMGLNENAVLKSMITNMDVNDSTKLNSAAYVHKLTERIGMGEELAAGANLTAAVNALNSNLAGLTGQYPLIYKGVYSGNLNTPPTPGYYQMAAPDTFQGAPEGTQFTGLIQFPEALFYTQIITGAGGQGGVKSRRFIGNPQSWTNWE